ncbi:hypothetical protein Vadar_022749 [Vaccinium darrowii]|uniref:Uncharacterized protein n=1 Tax=Vaccinium darrowii TaxID=229202 RepID=A0ACB7YXW0_9ERIC|nr:hypothetical protein Vadar_022749 [Vaccinium darrowii]
MASSLRKISSDIVKLDWFDGANFMRWQKKIYFLLSSLKVVYVLTTPKPAANEDETMAQAQTRLKWEQDDYICKGHILNAMSDPLFDLHQNKATVKEVWAALESNSKVMDKLPSTWKDCKKSLKHRKEELSLDELGNHLCIEEEFWARDNNEEHDSQSSKVHVVEEGQSSKQAFQS